MRGTWDRRLRNVRANVFDRPANPDLCADTAPMIVASTIVPVEVLRPVLQSPALEIRRFWVESPTHRGEISRCSGRIQRPVRVKSGIDQHRSMERWRPIDDAGSRNELPLFAPGIGSSGS